MKRQAVIFLVFAVLALIAGCTQPFSGSEAIDTGATSIGPVLPADQINDIARPPAGTFTFETVFPVELKLDVNLFETDESGRVLGDELAPDSGAVFVLLTDSEGNHIYSGKVSSDGTLNAIVYLPSAREDITMTLAAEGFEDRSGVISDMVDLSEVNRTVSMERIVPSDGSYLPRAISGLLDSDGDGVPDVYDAFPNDPGSAFEVNVPAEGKLTVAFEDLFGRANAGDADYNDFVAAYSITETLNDAGLVTSLTVHADAVTKFAGYDHRFGIRIDSFEGDAELSGEYIDGAGTEQFIGEDVWISAPAEIVLFENSRHAVGKSASFTLAFAVPQEHYIAGSGDALVAQAPLPNAPYNPFVIVIDTDHDIHLIGRQPLTELIESINPDDTFVDGDGFPWALLVPDDSIWEHPDECQRIETPYPRFTLWRESGGEDHSDWYLHYYDPWIPPVEEPVVYVAGYYNDGTQDVAAYWVDGVKTDLVVPDGSQGARATDIFVDGDDVYVAGYYESGSRTVATYWINDATPFDLPGISVDERSGATGIYVDDGAVYISGYRTTLDGITDFAVYWHGAPAGALTPEVLYSGSRYASAEEIVIHNSVVYVAGFYKDVPLVSSASYWAGGVVTDLAGGDPSDARDIEVTGDGVVYVVGRFFNGTTYASAYWENDATGRQTLHSSSVAGQQSMATGIDVAGTTVYTAGYYNNGTTDVAAYWQDSVQHDLSDGLIPGRAKDIEVTDEAIYVVGYRVDSGRKVAVIWEDGAATMLHDSGAGGPDAEGSSIFLVLP